LVRYKANYRSLREDASTCYSLIQEKVLCFAGSYVREVDLKTEKTRIIENYWGIGSRPLLYKKDDEQVLIFSTDYYFGDNNNAVQAFDLARYKRDLKNNKVKFIRDY
jgi:hypothetical protein